ncbi:(Fe-S)-binding protein [Siphonobacter curvatus]|uniref:Fe-S oxidoreductase n=1 Tax=Siphonobacter curvatus TaxID=2094562 RepID=A0A2S7ILX5_9BACT|nr:(Fe-S)-binding protein [Siphonobacter curvatus]PQA58722.1 Fe-S oxidoreductase [Siphonobacter curvatus]
MKVALFVPCYVDQFYPKVAVATLELLEKFGCEVDFPRNQTCCGQPMANSGFAHLNGGCDANFVRNFTGYDYIVAPSGSCVLHVKEHLHYPENQSLADTIRHRVYELTEFLTDILKVEKLEARFPHKVGVHQSCHGQRGLKTSQMSELNCPAFSKPGKLLGMVKDLQLVELDRKDECCGFGGTFAVSEESISSKMGKDRVADHQRHGAEYITAGDMSCLMHLEGILKRQKSPVRIVHIAEILNAQE